MRKETWYFHHQTKTKARQLHSNLRNSSLDNHTVLVFLSHIKSLGNSLCSIGDSVSVKENLDSLLEGLPQDSIIALVEQR